MTEPFHIRPISIADEPFLYRMLYYAAHVDEEGDTTVEDARQNPDLAKYVAGWGRAGDLGFAAIDPATEQAVGAVWVRLFVGPDKAYSPTADDTPELAIAVLPEYLGQGIGTRLMQALLTQAQGKYPAIALTVRADNPALRLYQRAGFETVGELVNRVGGKSYDMRLTLNSDLAG